MVLRTFVALELPEATQAAIADYVQPLSRLPGHVSWVKTQNLHLTLKFLGDTQERQINAITGALREVAREVPPFAATVTGSGVFPNERRPRVLWIGLEENSGRLPQLAKNVDQRLHELGFAKENRAFSAHLTVGRVRDGELERILSRMREQPFTPQPVQFDEITLMRSELHPGGSIYTPICKITLGNS